MKNPFDSMRQSAKRQAAKQFLEGEAAEAVLRVLTTIEQRLLEAVVEQHDVLNLDGAGAVPDRDDRAAELRQLWLAKAEGRFPAWWVETYADVEHPGEAVQYAGLDADAWAEQLATWADRYREAGVDGSDRLLANSHIKTRYGVGLEAFEEEVVEWSAERQSRELQRIMAGPVERAIGGIERATDQLRDQEAPDE